MDSCNASADSTVHRHFPGQRNGHVDASCAYMSAAYFQLHNIAKIRHCLTIDACKTIVHGLVASKLDYKNTVLCGINGRLLQKLQTAARVITQQRRQITPVLIALHWLPLHVIHKILVLTFRAMHDLAPEYNADMITEYTPGRQLRSAGSRLLRVPRHNLERYGRCGFSVTVSRLHFSGC